MEILYELAKHNTRYRKILEGIIPTNEGGQLYKLYEILYSDNKMNDHDAMLCIYGRVQTAAFSRLKQRMKDALLKTLIFQSSNSDSTDIRVIEGLSSYRQTLAARILLMKRSTKLSIELLEKSVIKSMKYHLTEGVLDQCRMLVTHYGSTEFNKYKFTKYLEIQKQYLNIYRWEIVAENYYFDLQRIQLQSLANTTEETKLKAASYVKELQNVKDVRSYSFNYNKYRLRAAYYEYTKDYISLLDLCEKANVEFNAPDFKTGLALSAITLRRVWALLQAGRLDECINVGIKGMSKETPGTNNWYYLAYYTLKACLYKGDYKSAVEMISKMINHPRYEKLGENFREIFNTSLGYIHLLIDSGLITDSKIVKKTLPEFKLGKFLNATPIFSKDKRGINVSILLMHIAFLLQRKDFNSIIDRIDSLNQYAYRYLRKDDSFRSNCMIKMLIQMAKADFNPIRTERYTKDLLKQLEHYKITGTGENIEVEVLPFELLWSIMTKYLE